MVNNTEVVDQIEMELIVQLKLIQDGTYGDGPDAVTTAKMIMA